ncbi:MAG: 2-dehydro-3-deoxygalactonokinase [Bacteroidota bacterium]|nr:2-dehydro-3-deoxygalactonokinase [Bacteroidota bacterium]
MKGHFISCDWGTTSFRLRLVNSTDKQVLAQIERNKGIAAVYKEWERADLPAEKRIDFFRNVLQQYLQEWTGAAIGGLPVIISGMASSSIGIKELPYGTLPFQMIASALTTFQIEPSSTFSHEIILVSGLKTEQDVMRGEETMLLGCETGDSEQLFIFPGTHSKHVMVKDGVAVDIKTYMSGEFFDLLANQSILSQSVSKSDDCNFQEYFEQGVHDSIGNNLLHTVFRVRTNQLFKRLSREQNFHYLSGLVIGAELAEIVRSKTAIHFVCGDRLLKNYQTAAAILCPGNQFRYSRADDALVNAHCLLWSFLEK